MAAEGDEDGTATEDPRTLALSDGLFAIALTLLVLSLHAPVFKTDDPTPRQVANALWDQHEALFAWLLSFYVIATNWLRHRELLAKITTVDGTITRLNLFYLAGISFLPFPTDVIAHYGSEWPSVALYATSLAITSVLLGLMAAHGDMPGHPRLWWLIPLIMLATIPLSLVFGTYALLLLLLMRLVPG